MFERCSHDLDIDLFHFELTKVECNYSNLFDNKAKVFSVCHRLRDILKRTEISRTSDLDHEDQVMVASRMLAAEKKTRKVRANRDRTSSINQYVTRSIIFRTNMAK